LRSTNAAVIKRVFEVVEILKRKKLDIYKSDQIKNALDETKCLTLFIKNKENT
jgi:hypothetical protein